MFCNSPKLAAFLVLLRVLQCVHQRTAGSLLFLSQNGTPHNSCALFWMRQRGVGMRTEEVPPCAAKQAELPGCKRGQSGAHINNKPASVLHAAQGPFVIVFTVHIWLVVQCIFDRWDSQCPLCITKGKSTKWSAQFESWKAQSLCDSGALLWTNYYRAPTHAH